MVLIKMHVKPFTIFLKNRYQRTKINKIFSSWSEILLRVSQDSNHGPLLFDIYLSNLIYLVEKPDISCNFANDATFRACDSNLDSLVKRIEHDANFAIECYDRIT